MPHNAPALTLQTWPPLPFAPDTVDRILAIGVHADGVLSVYLNVDPDKAQREGFEAALLELWKEPRAQLAGSELAKRLDEEIERVNAYVRSWEEPPGRALALFSCIPRDLFLPVALSVPALPGARFAPLPYVLPLIAAMDEHERYAIALVDRERARVMSVWMGRIEDRTQFEDPLPGTATRGGGWATGRGRREGSRMGPGRTHGSQAGYDRHIDYHIDLHLERVIAELSRLTRVHGATRILIGGPPEAVSALRRALPRSLSMRVAGEFAAELFAADSQILERVQGVEEQAERAHESQLVNEILERAPKGELAALGWDDTLTALAEGRAREAVLVEGEIVAGHACPEGHLAVTERIQRCPFCGEELWAVADLAAWALRRAFATDARIEFVRGEAADLLRQHGAGAILRY